MEHDYPELIDYKGPFKFCGKCRICESIFPVSKIAHPTQEELCRIFTGHTKEDLLKYIDSFDTANVGETLLACSLDSRSYKQSNTTYIRFVSTKGIIYMTTYGRDGARSMCLHPAHVPLDSSHASIRFRFALYGLTDRIDQSAVYSPHVDKHIYLSNEYIELINNLSFRNIQIDGHLTEYIHNNIMHIYKKYHPRATEIYNIEMKEKEIQKSIIDLQKKETSISEYKSEIDKQQIIINEQNEKLQKEKQIHRIKLKHLFERENSVKIKETLHSCKESLKNIALQLNDMYILTDNPDESIQSKLNDILGTLHTLYAEPIQYVVNAE